MHTLPENGGSAEYARARRGSCQKVVGLPQSTAHPAPSLRLILATCRWLLGARPPTLSALLIILLSAVTVRADVVQTVGSVTVDADSAADSSFDALAADPAIRETASGEWATSSTITLSAPANFAFDTTPNSVTATISPANSNRVDLGAGGGNPRTATPTASAIVFTVASAGSTKATISFSGIRLRATNCTGGTTGDASDITITTSSGLLNAAQCVDVAVSTGVTDHLRFTTQPATSAAGATVLPAVTIQDACGNTIIGDDRNITLAVQINPGSAALNGTASLLTVGGVATWTGVESLDMTVAANGYTLRASHDGAAFAGADTVDSAPFNITPDVADHLSVTTEPVNSTAGVSLLPVLTIQDRYNNTVTADDRTITLAMLNNPGSTTLNGTASVGTVSGVAVWTGTESLDITAAANGYTLQASHDGAAFAGTDTVDTAAFNITPGAADHLMVTTQPVNTTMGNALLPAITIQDQYNNTVTGDSRSITLAIQADPSSGAATLAGATALATVNGVATWTGIQNLNISFAADNYTLRASHDGAAFASSDTVDTAAFDITGGTADHLAFTTQPINTSAGVALVPVVTIEDAFNNPVTGDDRNITLTIQNNPGGAALNGTVVLATVNGVATWTGAQNLDITVAASGYTLRASHDGAAFDTFDTVDSAAINITSGSADHLAIATEPANTTAGASLLPSVTIEDQYDNTVTGDDRTITLAILNNPGSASLNGTVALATTNGVATWTGTQSLDITVAASGYTLRASHDGAAFSTSDTVDTGAFNITVDAADHLVLATEPVNTAVGSALLPAVRIEDQFGNTVTGDDRNITLAIQSDPSGGSAVLGGAKMRATVNGVATWTGAQDLNITVTGSGYTLRASHDGAAFSGSDTVDTASFDITLGSVDHLAITVQPVSGTAGVALVPEVTIQDQFNNTVVGDDRTITLTIQANPGSATLNGTVSLVTVNGVATWTGTEALDITVPGTGYTLRAAHDGAVFASSDTVDTAAFNITPDVADHLAFSVEPADTAAGTALVPAVTIEDQFGNVVPGDDRNITLAILNNPGVTTLNGTVSLATVNGVAAWTAGEGMNITVAANDYTLQASHDGAAFASSDTADSAAFDITLGVADHLEFTVEPVETAAGTALVPTLAIHDAFNNVVTGDDRNITLVILNNPGATTLNGTVTVATVNGLAAWTGGDAMNITVPGVGYTLQASHDGAVFATSDTAVSAAFTITTGAADHLDFTLEPVNTSAGVTLLPQVAIEDQFHNAVTGDDRTITLTIQSNPGSATLNGTVALATVNGVATWTGTESLDITVKADSYTLRASHDGAAFATSDTVDSAAFNITPDVADHLAITTEPVNTVAGVALVPAVSIQDQYNNTVTDDNRNITLTIQTDPSSGAASLAGATTLATGGGVATWTGVQDLNITVAASGYTLRASHDGSVFASSNTVDTAAFDITPGVADHLKFVPQPVNTTAGSAIQPQVTIQDQFNNRVTGDDRTITLVLEDNPGADTLNGTASLATTNGLAAWTGAQNLNLTVAASGYTLRATHDGAAFASSDTLTSAAFNITSDAADHLFIRTEPVHTAAGAALLPEVRIRDQYNNTVTGDDRNITLAILNNPGGGALNGTAVITTVSGIATWTGGESLDIRVAAGGYTLRASHDGAVFATSDTVDSVAFNITAGPADHLAFTTDPANTTAAGALLPAVVIQDQYDNTITSDNRGITLAIQTDPSGGSASLAGVKTLVTVNGTASWVGGHNLNMTVAANGYTLRASHDGGVFASSDTVDSGAFNITPGVPDHVDMKTQPVNTVAGADLVPAVAIEDVFHNTVTGDDRNITLTVQSNPGSATLNGTASVSTINGVATWTATESLNLTVTAAGYTLRASHDGAGFASLDTVDSAAFAITPGAADHLTFSTEPVHTVAGINLVPVVTIEDQFDNTVTGDDRSITLSILNNPVGATLNGTTSLSSVSGIAAWTATESLDITTAATGYTFRASHDGAALATSDTADSTAFNINVGPLAAFLVQASPVSLTAGDTTSVTITARDALVNPIPDFDPTIDINITVSAGGPTTISYADGAVGNVVIEDNGDATAMIDASGAETFDSNGQATFTLTSTQQESSVTITVGDGTATGDTAFTGTNVTWTAAPGPPAPPDDPSDDGVTYEASATDSTGQVVAAIEVTDAYPDEFFNITLPEPDPDEAFFRVAQVTTSAEPGTYMMTIRFTITPADLEAQRGTPADVEMLHFDEDAQLWVALENNVGDAPPTGVLNECGYYLDANEEVTVWAVVDHSGTFAVAMLAFPPPVPDEDADQDGVIDSDDNCPSVANASQTDDDEDGTGNACDRCRGSDDRADLDADGVPDDCDNCPSIDNPAQRDADDDGVGDACDVCDGPDDEDTDGDSVPDACDVCPGFDDRADGDGDGLPDGCDGCPEDPEKSAPGTCGCGVDDTDSDDDGIPDCAGPGESDNTNSESPGDPENTDDNTESQEGVIPAGAGRGATGFGCGAIGPAIILSFFGLIALRFAGPRWNP